MLQNGKGGEYVEHVIPKSLHQIIKATDTITYTNLLPNQIPQQCSKLKRKHYMLEVY